MARLSIQLLGPAQVTVDGAPLRVDTRKAVALLAWLALNEGRHSRDSLAALFWPETELARAALRRTLSTLHNALGHRWLDIERDSVALVAGDDVWIDAAAFRAHCAAGDSDSLERAVALARGEFMAGFSLRDSVEFDDWVARQAESLRRDLIGALEALARQRIAARQFEPAGRDIRRWLAIDPLHEDAHRLLMLVYAWVGDRSAALRQYRECVRVLDAELGVPPLDETTALYQSILDDRVPPPPDPPALPDLPPAAPPEARPPAPVAAPPAGDFPLVGRDGEMAALIGAWQASRERGRMAVVHGEAGIGKTRLARESLRAARERGAATMLAASYDGEASLAYAPFVDGLRDALSRMPERRAALDSLPPWARADLARLLPELGAAVSQAGPSSDIGLDSPGGMTRWHDSLLSALDALLAGPEPGVLFLDDAQWLDAASLDLLSFLVHRLDRRPFLLLLAWRDEQVSREHRLRRALSDAARHGAASDIALSRLNLDEVRELTRQAAGPEAAGLAQRLRDETEGLPFFLIEYLRELRQRSSLDDAEVWDLPDGARDLLRQRLASVPAIESQLLTTLAAAGRACALDLLVEASGRSVDEAVGAIEGLLARGLVVEQRAPGGAGEPLYAFSHDKMRELVYADTSLARRRLMHRRVADALLSSSRPGQQLQVAPQAAMHYRLAGEDVAAAEQHRIAGDLARDLRAAEDALSHYRTALALGHSDSAALHAAIGDQCTLLGRYDEAFDAYEAAAALSDPARLGDIERKLGNLNHRLGRWERAERHFEAAVAALSSESSADGASLARVYADWSLTGLRRDDLREALDRARRATSLADGAGDALAQAQAKNLLGIISRYAGALDEAKRLLRESLALSSSLRDASGRIAALNNLALVQADADDYSAAIDLATEALEACVALGDRHREAALRSNLADYLHAAGRAGESREHLAASARIYADIGVVAGEPQPEIWKLTEW